MYLILLCHVYPNREKLRFNRGRGLEDLPLDFSSPLPYTVSYLEIITRSYWCFQLALGMSTAEPRQEDFQGSYARFSLLSACLAESNSRIGVCVMPSLMVKSELR